MSSPLTPIAALIIVMLAGGCSVESAIDDPLVELAAPGVPARQIVAMDMLEEQPESQLAYVEALHKIIWRPGFPTSVREEALRRLERHDLDGLKLTIRRQLPQMESWRWVEELCGIIADRGWVELTPGLVSSWARPLPYIEDTKRPEYLTLAKLHGSEQVIDVVFDIVVQSTSVLNENLRFRAWELMHRLGQRERLVQLVQSSQPDESDLMMQDLRTVAQKLGIVPWNREEIRWARELLKPRYAALWERIQTAAHALSPSRRAELELRSLTIIASAYLHDPSLLQRSESELYVIAEDKLRGVKHYGHGSSHGGTGSGSARLLSQSRDKLNWTDLAAILIALQALEVPEVIDHLFDYAERDRLDTGTEYGGLITLDEQGRFEILEFSPRIRQNDQRFNAPNEMFDASYGAVFHFHFHAQQLRNSDYAGPGIGDINYADNTRANCLVLTSVSSTALNVDFYRHGQLIVDLGTVERR